MSSILSDAAVAATNAHLDVDYNDVVYYKLPLLKTFKVDVHGGNKILTSIKTAQTTSVGADMTGAISASASLARKQFSQGFASTMAVGEVSTNDIDLMADDQTSVVDAMVDSSEDAMRAAAKRVARNLAGDGFGTQFIIASHSGSSSPFTLTATRVTDLAFVDVGDIMVSSVAANSASLDTGSFTVSTIDRSAGTLVVTTGNSWAGASNDTHYCFFSLDKVSGSYDQPICGLGLDFWIPMTAPTTDESAICGVDRRSDVENLAGVRVDGRKKAIKVAITLATAKLGIKQDADPDLILMNPNTLATLQNDLGSGNYTRTSDGDSTTYGFDEIYASFPGVGKIRIVGAIEIKEDRFYVLSTSKWKLHQAKAKLIYPDGRGNKAGFIDHPTRASVQHRQKAVWGLSCSFPGANAVVQIA